MNTYAAYKPYENIAVSRKMDVHAPHPVLNKKKTLQLITFSVAFFFLELFVGQNVEGIGHMVCLFLPVALILVIAYSGLLPASGQTWVNAFYFVLLNLQVFVIGDYFKADAISNISFLCMFLFVPRHFTNRPAKWFSIAIICTNICLQQAFYHFNSTQVNPGNARNEWLSSVESIFIVAVCSTLILRRDIKVENERRQLLFHIDSLKIELLKAQKRNSNQRAFFRETFHEIRGTFFGVSSIIRWLADADRNGQIVSQNENFYHLNFAVDNLSSVLDNLLDYAKAEEGVPETANINLTLIQEVFLRLIEVMGHEAQYRGIKIDLIFDDDLPQVIDTDEDKILKIARNLISNAIKYSRDNSTVTIEVGVLDSAWHIVVSDNGIGIPSDRVRDIFDPFVILQSAGRNIYQMGIGLSVVEKLVKVLGGKIAVWSELNVGTQFTVSLPLNTDIYAEA
jgi:signal transduction histidine kinase